DENEVVQPARPRVVPAVPVAEDADEDRDDEEHVDDREQRDEAVLNGVGNRSARHVAARPRMPFARAHRHEEQQAEQPHREAGRLQPSFHPQRALRLRSWRNDGQAATGAPVETDAPAATGARAQARTAARIAGRAATGATAETAVRATTGAAASCPTPPR